ncbi:unnamed protein product [Choristocarpus tenellus]
MFTSQVVSLVEIVDMTLTPKLRQFDKATIDRAMGWGTYIEQVVESLREDWRRQRLKSVLDATFHTRVWPHDVNVSRLAEARRWVLFSMMGSMFLGDHPRPKLLMKWIMREYTSLSLFTANQGNCPSPPEVYSKSLSVFVDDASKVMRSRANTAILSHACSALNACSSGGGSSTGCKLMKGEGISVIPSCSCTWGFSRDVHLPITPCTYEVSIETAQKRAYASNCYSLLMCKHEEDKSGHTDTHMQEGETAAFLHRMSALARGDPVVLEIMCLMLLEIQRRSMLQSETSGEQQLGLWAQGLGSLSHLIPLLKAPPHNELLHQVLAFKDDNLWLLDPWLLAELSHFYTPFAEVYVAHLLQCSKLLVEAEMEGLVASPHINLGVFQQPYIKSDGLDMEVVQKLKTIWTRLSHLAARSSRLELLCQQRLENSGLWTSMHDIFQHHGIR